MGIFSWLNPFKRKANNAASNNQQTPAPAQQDSDSDQQNQNPQRGNAFYITNTLKAPAKSWISVIVLFFILTILWLWRFNYLRPVLEWLLTRGAFVLLLFFIGWGIVHGIIDASKGKPDGLTKLFISLALAIWLFDMMPPINIPGFGRIFNYPPYAGFELPFAGLVEVNWIPIFTSSLVFIMLYIDMIFNIFNKKYISIGLGFFLILIINNGLARLARFFPDTLNWGFSLYFPNWQGLKAIAFYLLLAAVLGILIYIAIRLDRIKGGEEFAGFFTYLFMILVFSFFWVNNGWLQSPKAIIHAIFIIAFGFAYIKPHETNPAVWHVWIPLLLIADFYGYGALWNLPYLWVKFIPIFVLFVIGYCYHKSQSSFAILTFLVLITVILILSLDVTAFAESGSFDYKQRAGGADYNQFFSTLGKNTKLLIERQLVFATGGLYRSQVELNQYAPLGVFFERVRAAQPRFYDDEPVTLWATISARTLGDPVVVNFDCSRWNGNTRVNLQSDDKLTPPYPFTVGTYEEKDVECTFSEKKLPAGLNTISLSATYNFDTSAYQKLYFMDKERLRAMRRENLDPLKEYGITDLSIDATEDQGPATIYTNGPVELAVRAGNKLIAVSNDKDIYPVLEILLQNRNKITDKNGNPVGEWEGKINKVNDLVVVLPAGMKLLTGSCNPVQFEEINDTSQYCKDSCTEVCKNSCEEYNYDPDKKKSCIEACPDPLKSDTRKKCDSQCLGLFRGDTTGEKKYNGYKLDIKKLNELDPNNNYRDIDKYKTFQCRITADQSVLDNVPITTKYIRLKARYDYLLEKSYDVAVEKAPVEFIPVGSQQAIDNAVGKVKGGYVQLGDISIPYNSLNALVYLESRGRHCCMESGKNRATTCKPSDDASCTAEKVLTSFDGSSIGIMQINTKCENKNCSTCETCAQRNRRMEQKVCAPDQNIYNRACNINVGLEILKEAYKNYGDGIKEDKLGRSCSTKWEFDGRNLYNLYKSYRGFDAVARSYNGWGCNVDAIKSQCSNPKACNGKEPCISNCIRGTVFYVDTVNGIAKQLQSGLQAPPLTIDELPNMEDFEDSATAPK